LKRYVTLCGLALDLLQKRVTLMDLLQAAFLRFQPAPLLNCLDPILSPSCDSYAIARKANRFAGHSKPVGDSYIAQFDSRTKFAKSSLVNSRPFHDCPYLIQL
jgi:hypothetical protein